MPSLDIHIAIARKYLQMYSDVKDVTSFIKGTLAPDLAVNRSASHYAITIQGPVTTLKILNNKVDLKAYLQDKSVANDYEKGYFLHLLTDYLFFTTFFSQDLLQNMAYPDFKKNLYYSYNLLQNHLQTNYDIDYHPFAKEAEERIITSQVNANYYGEKRKNIIPPAKLDEFINHILQNDVTYYLDKYKNREGEIINA